MPGVGGEGDRSSTSAKSNRSNLSKAVSLSIEARPCLGTLQEREASVGPDVSDPLSPSSSCMRKHARRRKKPVNKKGLFGPLTGRRSRDAYRYGMRFRFGLGLGLDLGIGHESNSMVPVGFFLSSCFFCCEDPVLFVLLMFLEEYSRQAISPVSFRS